VLLLLKALVLIRTEWWNGETVDLDLGEEENGFIVVLKGLFARTRGSTCL